MARRKKTAVKPPAPSSPSASSAPIAAHPPEKRPWLLAASIVLFGLWFFFLVYSATFG